MPKTPDEIKKGLECCRINNEDVCECEECPYATNGHHTARCDIECAEDALAYIQQLEAEKASLLRDLREANRIDCIHCRHYRDELLPCSCECDTCEIDCACKDCRDNSCWEWRGVQKED